MHCQRCGSTDFDEENGVFYCTICQTQTQGFTQESAEVFIDRTKIFAKEIKSKKRKTKGADRKTSVLWTTTEAFNIILFKQMNGVFELNASHMDWSAFKKCATILWFSYLRKCGLGFTGEETADAETITRRLHPASRFRDFQILTNKVSDSLPPFKNGSSAKGFVGVFKLGADGVVRTVEELDSLDEYVCHKSDKRRVNDVFSERNIDPRDYSKQKPYEMMISKESRRLLMKVLSEMDLKNSVEETIGLSEKGVDFSDDTDIQFDSEDSSSEEVENLDQKPHHLSDDKDNVSIISDQWFESDDKFDEFDKELMRNLTETTKLYAKYIPLSYLKNSKYIASDYFIDFMCLPKTLAILNIAMRLLSYDIFTIDLIRWANDGRIPYQNCMTCLPEEWLFISNDFHTFTSSFIPSYQTINTLSAKIAKHIGVKTFPRPNLENLLTRFAKDLNLPKDIVSVIENNYNLYEHFSSRLERMAINMRKVSTFPAYERWALMAIVLVLKRIFLLNDSSEKRLSYYSRDLNQYFNWYEWEQYSRVRLELITSYTTSLYGCKFEDIKDVDVIVEHSLKRSDYEMTKTIECIKRGYKYYDFRQDLRQEFKSLLLNENDSQKTESVYHSLYPLTTATELALKRVTSPAVKEVLSTNFEDKSLSGWTCSHGKVFHRGYDFLHKDPKQWSSTFKLLIRLSCIILCCRTKDLIPIINRMETIYFSNKSMKKKFKR